MGIVNSKLLTEGLRLNLGEFSGLLWASVGIGGDRLRKILGSYRNIYRANWTSRIWRMVSDRAMRWPEDVSRVIKDVDIWKVLNAPKTAF